MNMARFPGIRSLEAKAAKRIPRFAWEYLDSGEGPEHTKSQNEAALNSITITPRFLKGPLEPDASIEIFGQRYASPVGIAPIGLTGLIWPGSDGALARCAATSQIAYVASTVSTGLVEEVGPLAEGRGWFQLYPPRKPDVRESLVKRAEAAGFGTLVVTADVPAPSRRERQTRAGIQVPPRITPRLVAQAVTHPAWGMGVIRNGLPRFKTLETYVDRASMRSTAGFVGANLGGTLGWDYLSELRAMWSGPLVLKDILHPDDAQRCVDVGADGIIVSNHGGRQLDAAPASITALPAIVDQVGNASTVMFDSGVRSGLDAARALALGAQMVFAGRAFMFGLGALGMAGPDHVAEIFRQEILTTMHQLGCASIDELRSLRVSYR